MKRSVYEIVTEQILNQLDEGVIPWQKPWVLAKGKTYNRVSEREYSLLNRMMLGRKGEYATYKQWQGEGFQVAPGERGKAVAFWCEFEDKKADPIGYNDDGTPIYPKYPCLRYYTVFHISQTDCDAPKHVEENTTPVFNDIESAEKLIAAYAEREGIKLDRDYVAFDYRTDHAWYDPDEDKITIPSRHQFKDVSRYYSTVFYELVRSTGAQCRLNRHTRSNECGYNKEGLIAEIGAACIMNMLGIDTESSIENTTAHIAEWTKVLKDDPRMIVGAVSAAEKAVKLITGESAVEDKPQQEAAD